MNVAANPEDDLAFVQASMGTDLDVMLVYSLLRTQQHLAPLIDAQLKQAQLTAAQFNVLLVLHAAGDAGLLMGQLGRQLIVTKSNITGLVDKLERQQLVQRQPQADRRATCIILTRQGAAVVKRLIPRQVRLLGALTDCLTAAEKKTVIRLLSKLRKGLRQRRTPSRETQR